MSAMLFTNDQLFGEGGYDSSMDYQQYTVAETDAERLDALYAIDPHEAPDTLDVSTVATFLRGFDRGVDLRVTAEHEVQIYVYGTAYEGGCFIWETEAMTAAEQTSRDGLTQTAGRALGRMGLTPSDLGEESEYWMREWTVCSSQVLTVAEVAARLGLAVSTVYAYRRDDVLPAATMVGRTPTWTAEQIDEWEKSRPGRGAGGGRPKKEAS